MVCTDSGDGKCKNGEDMGESKECPSGQVCVFVVDEYEGETTYSRRCDSDPGTPCIEDSQEGVSKYRENQNLKCLTNSGFFSCIHPCVFAIQKIAIQEPNANVKTPLRQPQIHKLHQPLLELPD